MKTWFGSSSKTGPDTAQHVRRSARRTSQSYRNVDAPLQQRGDGPRRYWDNNVEESATTTTAAPAVSQQAMYRSSSNQKQRRRVLQLSDPPVNELDQLDYRSTTAIARYQNTRWQEHQMPGCRAGKSSLEAAQQPMANLLVTPPTAAASTPRGSTTHTLSIVTADTIPSQTKEVDICEKRYSMMIMASPPPQCSSLSTVVQQQQHPPKPSSDTLVSIPPVAASASVTQQQHTSCTLSSSRQQKQQQRHCDKQKTSSIASASASPTLPLKSSSSSPTSTTSHPIIISATTTTTTTPTPSSPVFSHSTPASSSDESSSSSSDDDEEEEDPTSPALSLPTPRLDTMKQAVPRSQSLDVRPSPSSKMTGRTDFVPRSRLSVYGMNSNPSNHRFAPKAIIEEEEEEEE